MIYKITKLETPEYTDIDVGPDLPAATDSQTAATSQADYCPEVLRAVSRQVDCGWLFRVLIWLRHALTSSVRYSGITSEQVMEYLLQLDPTGSLSKEEAFQAVGEHFNIDLRDLESWNRADWGIGFWWLKIHHVPGSPNIVRHGVRRYDKLNWGRTESIVRLIERKRLASSKHQVEATKHRYIDYETSSNPTSQIARITKRFSSR